MKNYRRLATTFALSAFTLSAHGAGFQVSEHSASGLGRAYAGEAAMTDNASTMARNPATMITRDTSQLSGAIHIVSPDINVKDETNNQQASNIAPTEAVPGTYYVTPINEKLSAGIGLYTVYGVGTDYPDDFAAGDISGDTKLVSVNLNPAVAYRLDENLTVGAGLNVVYAIAELNRHFGKGAVISTSKPSDILISMEGKTFGWGVNLGALYEVDADNRFGASYRSGVQLKFKDGDFTDNSGNVLSSKSTVNADLKVTLPAIFEFSGFHQLNPSWAVHYSAMWTEWSEFTELKATGSACASTGGVCFEKQEEYSDVVRWSLGTTHTLNDEWTLRAGLALDEQAGKSTLSIPDTDRFWYSAGATYQYSPDISFDAGLTLVSSKDGTFTETSKVAGTSKYSAKGKAYIVAAQVNYSF
ncbi:outer membrane protein transport protein [Veronia pacifica]|uniref:outer membrane protein transport protein n=1 Tax=Veronia pacifica TaxID=1080227 RepID=UPI00363DCB4A